MSQNVPLTYAGLFEFLEDYRANLSQLRATIPADVGTRIGDEFVLEVSVPVLDEVVSVQGRVMYAQGGQAGLQLDPDAGDGLPRLEGFYRFTGKMVEAMLRSGRVKVTGQWEPGAVPTVVSSVAGAPPRAAAPPPRVGAPMIEQFRDRDLGPVTAQGPLDEKAISDILMQLAREKGSGILDLRGESARRLCFIKAGGPVQFLADPVLQDECLGVLLHKAGRLSEDQLKKSLTMMAETGQKQGQCLIELGVLTFPQLVVSLMTQTEIILRSMLKGGKGTWTWHGAAALDVELVTPPMKTPGFLFRYFQKRSTTMREDELTRYFEPRLDHYTTVAKDIPWDDMRLKTDEKKFVEILQAKSRRLRETYTVSNLGRSSTSQLLFALIELRMLDFVDLEDEVQVHERWRRQLRTKIDNLEKQNPFEQLEVHWTSRSPHVEGAWARLRKEYEGFGRGATLPPELDAMRQEILDALRRSYTVLKEPASRQEERKKHYEAQQLDFSADLLFKQGEMLMVRGRWADVIDNFERAVELMPNVPKYRQFLANAQKSAAGGGAAGVGDDD